MDVKLENHYGADVFVSMQAEAARKTGCLCVHTENGKTTMCSHLKKNIEMETQLKKRVEGFVATWPGNKEKLAEELKSTIKDKLLANGEEALKKLVKGSAPIADDGTCRLAQVNYAACLTGNLAMAVTRCPYYEPEKS